MIFAKTKQAEGELLSAFRERRAKKSYLALVVGTLPKKHAVEEAFLQKDEKRALVKISEERGEKIVTEYEVLEERGETSLVRVTLHSGKTHQIRAHLGRARRGGYEVREYRVQPRAQSDAPKIDFQRTSY